MTLSPTLICDKYLSLLSLADRVGPRQRELVTLVFERAGEHMSTAMKLRDLLSFEPPLCDSHEERAARLHAQSSLVRVIGESVATGTRLEAAIASWRDTHKARLLEACAAHPLTPGQLEIAFMRRTPANLDSDALFAAAKRALRRTASS